MAVFLDLEGFLINDVVEEIAAALGVVVDAEGRLLEAKVHRTRVDLAAGGECDGAEGAVGGDGHFVRLCQASDGHEVSTTKGSIVLPIYSTCQASDGHEVSTTNL